MKSARLLNPDRSMANYSLIIADASAFTAVQSCISIASDLRRDLAEKAQVLSTQHPVDIAIALLGAAELGWGRGKSSQLVTLIVDSKKLDALRRAKVYKLVREGLSKLPLTLWGEKMTSRRELLEELEKYAILAVADVPRFPTKMEIREEEWREAVQARPAMRHATTG